MNETLQWEPPGPGSWRIDRIHVPRPSTAYVCETVAEPLAEGFTATARRYGLPMGAMLQQKVNGFSYGARLPLAPEEMPQRIAAAVETLEAKRWRDDLQRWDNEAKPAAVTRALELLAVDPSALDAGALVAHLRECRAFHQAMVRQHHEFNGTAMVPLGDFLAGAMEWTGLPATRLLPLFAGASPISQGSCAELDRVVRALQEDARAASILDGADAGAVLDALAARGGEVGDAIREWLRLAGQRIVDGFDICYPRAVERPAVLVGALRSAVAGRAAPDVSEELAAIRAMVPAEHRADFDERYAEARATYRVRDERGIYSDITAYGILRRAYLAAGDVLVEKGRLPKRELAIDAGFDELVALLEGTGGPAAEELERRARHRATYTVADAPSELGDASPPPALPETEDVPPAAVRVWTAFFTVSSNMWVEESTDHSAGVVRGVAASSGVHEGTARLVREIDDLGRLEPGDVLVAITTGEAFNLAFSLVNAVVTDHGGALSHAAILAREYGIPAVVGTGVATATIPDGVRVRVDGTSGEVTWS